MALFRGILILTLEICKIWDLHRSVLFSEFEPVHIPADKLSVTLTGVNILTAVFTLNVELCLCVFLCLC